ncbi:MAG: hypothetical protein GX078_01695 [Clostridiales bacterium]|nr:hypothetical protein [Clostridiales bacterium]
MDSGGTSIDETIDLPYASAIRGVSHKCGHDGHADTLVAFAMEVESFGSDKDIYLFFQHAEENRNRLNELKENIEKRVDLEANKYGLKFDIAYSDLFSETSNNDEIVEKIKYISEVHDYILNDMDVLKTSEDYGYFLKKTKGAMMWIGAGENSPSLHATDFNFNGI